MAAAQTKPFAYDDVFALDGDAAPAREPRFTADNVETARLEGYDAGARDAKAREEAAQTALLQSIAAALTERRSAFETALAAHRKAMNAIAAALLKRFCEKLAGAREIALAQALLDRTANGATEQAPATLKLTPESLAALRPQLEELLKARGLDGFVALEADAGLCSGEARVEWRGGAMTQRLAPAFEKIDAIIESAAPAGEDTPSATPDPDTEVPS